MQAHAPPAAPAAVAPPPAPRPVAGISLDVETLCWAGVVALATLWRLPSLGARLPTTVEALQARAAWDFAWGTASPGWLPDVSAALSAALLRGAGDDLGWARLPSALFGIATVALLYCLRPYAGRAVAIIGAALVAVSPIAVAASRTVAPDAAALLAGLAALLLLLRLTERGDRQALPLLGAATGIALTTGAVAIALLIVGALWCGVEMAWQGRADAARRWHDATADRALVAAAVMLALPGVMFGVVRFGAGADALALPALADWSGPPPLVPHILPWHALLGALAGYEPLALVLGGAGAVDVFRRLWRGSATAPFERLLLVWLAAGAVLSLATLHDRAGHFTNVSLPLALLAANATVRVVAGVRAWPPGSVWPALAPVPLLAGFAALRLLAWANEAAAQADALPLVLASGACLALIAWALWRLDSRLRPAGLAALAWLGLGWVSLNGASAVAFTNGAEYLLGGRGRLEQTAVTLAITANAGQESVVPVEQTVAAPLAWALRGNVIDAYVGLPPEAAVVVRRFAGIPTPRSTPVGSPAPVEEQWYPRRWDGRGMVRWVVYREPWAPYTTVSAQVTVRGP